MPRCETVKVSDGKGGYIVINKSDLTDKHSLFKKPARKRAAKKKVSK